MGVPAGDSRRLDPAVPDLRGPLSDLWEVLRCGPGQPPDQRVAAADGPGIWLLALSDSRSRPVATWGYGQYADDGLASAGGGRRAADCPGALRTGRLGAAAGLHPGRVGWHG